MVQSIGSLLAGAGDSRRHQQSQLKRLKTYIEAEFPEIKTAISIGRDRITIRAPNASDACRLKLDWENIQKHCRPGQKLVIAVGGG